MKIKKEKKNNPVKRKKKRSKIEASSIRKWENSYKRDE